MAGSIRTAGALAVAAVAASAFVAPAAVGSVAKATSTVYIIQGVPGATVDIELDGKSVGADVAAKAIIGPLTVSRGTHEVSFEADDWAVGGSVTVTKASADVVVHLPADSTDEPETTVFANDVDPVAAGKARLTVAHTAVVPPADILADDAVLFSNIANGEFVTAEVPAATYKVAVVPTGQTKGALLGPLDLPVEAGQLTRVFAIGSPDGGTMDAVVQVLPVGKSGSPAPGSVDAGEAGLAAGIQPAAATSDSDGAFDVSVLTLAGLVCAGLSFAALRSRRSTR